jgi:type VI secretion system protein ImpA
MNASNFLADRNQILTPIAGDLPAGEDMGLSTLFDQIRQARHADDPALTQGVWKSDLKVAEWGKVKDLTGSLLATKSKDLQAVLWLSEALTQLHGFQGFSESCTLICEFLESFWDHLHPVIEGGDLDARAGRFAWFDRQMPLVIRRIPVTTNDSGGYCLLQWQEAMQLENQGARDAEAAARQVQQGKLTRDIFERAVNASGKNYYLGLLPEVRAAVDSFYRLRQLVNEKMSAAAPSFASVESSLDDVLDAVTRFAKQVGAVTAVTPNTDRPPSSVEVLAIESSAMPVSNNGPIKNRAEAVSRLREVAKFFRETEPHSPVAYLAEKAASWGGMQLDEWLRAVVKDESVMAQLAELLGVTNRAGTKGDGSY